MPASERDHVLLRRPQRHKIVPLAGERRLAEVSVIPQDSIPRASARGDRHSWEGVVALTWDASDERDLLGYVVYRREPPQLVPIRLAEQPIPGRTFADRTARRGATYIYTVTAVDRSARRNESVPSAEVQVDVP
jgi:hypothetical protein